MSNMTEDDSKVQVEIDASELRRGDEYRDPHSGRSIWVARGSAFVTNGWGEVGVVVEHRHHGAITRAWDVGQRLTIWRAEPTGRRP